MKSTNGMGVGKGGGREKVLNSGQRLTMGTQPYSMKPDTPSSSEFRNGMLEAKPGVDKSGAPVGGKSNRKNGGLARANVRAYGNATMITHKPGFVENASTQANGRIVPAVMGPKNFWDESRSL